MIFDQGSTDMKSGLNGHGHNLKSRTDISAENGGICHSYFKLIVNILRLQQNLVTNIDLTHFISYFKFRYLKVSFKIMRKQEC